MKVVFEYKYEDGCYGYVDTRGERTEEFELDGSTEVRLPPCNKNINVKVIDESVEIELPFDRHMLVSTEKTPFIYTECYESFGDLRDIDLSGTVRIIKDIV